MVQTEAWKLKINCCGWKAYSCFVRVELLHLQLLFMEGLEPQHCGHFGIFDVQASEFFQGRQAHPTCSTSSHENLALFSCQTLRRKMPVRTSMSPETVFCRAVKKPKASVLFQVMWRCETSSPRAPGADVGISSAFSVWLAIVR